MLTNQSRLKIISQFPNVLLIEQKTWSDYLFSTTDEKTYNIKLNMIRHSIQQEKERKAL